MLGAPVSWQSKSQKSVSLSSSKAEYMFIIQLLRSMKISIKIKITIRVNNEEAIFVANNITTMSCTKHVNIRYKYMNEYLEDGVHANSHREINIK